MILAIALFSYVSEHYLSAPRWTTRLGGYIVLGTVVAPLLGVGLWRLAPFAMAVVRAYIEVYRMIKRRKIEELKRKREEGAKGGKRYEKPGDTTP